MELQPSQTILNGKYRIERLLGRGAFGEVYLATHRLLNAPVAIKVLRHDAPGVGSTEFGRFRERFLQEAQLGKRLNHPNVVRVDDFSEDAGVLYLVMEFCAGGSLADRLATDRPLAVDEAVRIALDVAHGLAALHALDAVHRDLKPSNILFDAQGRARVGDLGLAQAPGSPSRSSLLGSQARPQPGTPDYMSPEQAANAPRLAPPSDIYSLGAVLFEMLTGRIYGNLRSGTRAKPLRGDVPAWLDDLIARMLAQVPEDRLWDGAEATRLLNEGWQRLAAEQRMETEAAKQVAGQQRRAAAGHAHAEETARLATVAKAEAEAERWTFLRGRRRLSAGVGLGLVGLSVFIWALTQPPGPSNVARTTSTGVSAAASTVVLAPTDTPTSGVPELNRKITETPTPARSPTPTASPSRPIATASATASGTPTATPAPPTATATSTATLEPSATPTPLLSLIVTNASVNVRSGPGTVYAVIGALRAGQTATITGRNTAGDWWQFAYQGQPAWVSRQVVSVSGPATEIPIPVAPPTPKPQLDLRKPSDVRIAFLGIGTCRDISKPYCQGFTVLWTDNAEGESGFYVEIYRPTDVGQGFFLDIANRNGIPRDFYVFNCWQGGKVRARVWAWAISPTGTGTVYPTESGFAEVEEDAAKISDPPELAHKVFSEGAFSAEYACP